MGDPTEVEDISYWGTILTTNRVAIQGLQLTTDRLDRAKATKIARCLRNLGWKYQNIRVKLSRGDGEAVTVKGWTRALSRSPDQGTLLAEAQ
jgi:hypothetical protein